MRNYLFIYIIALTLIFGKNIGLNKPMSYETAVNGLIISVSKLTDAPDITKELISLKDAVRFVENLPVR